MVRNKFITKVLLATTLFATALSVGSFLKSNDTTSAISNDIIETALDSFNKENGIKLQNTVLENEISYSKTFTQYGVNSDGQYCLRFATAVKGEIETLSYKRAGLKGIEGKDQDVITSLDTVYYSIYSGDEKVYYTGDASVDNGLSSDEQYRGLYYWACYTITFGDYQKYLSTDISVNLIINESDELDTRVTNLETLMVNNNDLIKIEAEKVLGSSRYPEINEADKNYIVPNSKYAFNSSNESKYIVSKDTEPASGGAYLGEFNGTGKGVTVYVNSKESCVSNLYISASSGVIEEGIGEWVPTKMKDLNLSDLLTVKVNGVNVDIAAEVILPGSSIEDVGEGNNSLLWINWRLINLGKVNLNIGYNVIVVEVKNAVKHNTNGGYGALNIDYFCVEPTNITNDVCRIEVATDSFDGSNITYAKATGSTSVKTDDAQTASGKAYLGDVNNTNITITVHIYSDVAKTISLNMCASSAAIEAYEGDNVWAPTKMQDIKLNHFFDVKFNGNNYGIDDSVVLKGGTIEDVGAGNNGSLWVYWTLVNLGEFELQAGDNKIEFKVVNLYTHADSGYNGGINLDYFEFNI